MLNSKSVFMALLCVLLIYGCGKQHPIRIGFSGNLTGRLSDVGVDARNGALLAVEEINRQGGIHGTPMELVIKDDKNDPATAVQVDRDLIQSGVPVIIGHIMSGMSLAVLPLMQESKMLLISPTSVSNVFNRKDDYFIRLSPGTEFVLSQLSAYVYQRMGLSRLSYIYDLSNRGYSEDWLKNFSSKFEALGGKTLSAESFTSGNEVPFYDIAKKVLLTHPEAVVLISGAVDAALLSQQIKKISPATQIIIAGWAMTDDLIRHGGKSVEGAVISYNYDKDSQIPSYLAFKRNFQKRFGVNPDFTAKYSYETVMVLAEVFREIDQISPDGIRNRILQKKSFAGLQGPIEIDAYGDAVPRITIFTVKNGQYQRMN